MLYEHQSSSQAIKGAWGRGFCARGSAHARRLGGFYLNASPGLHWSGKVTPSRRQLGAFFEVSAPTPELKGRVCQERGAQRE